MAKSNHCLLDLSLRKSSPSKPTSRRFVFEAMWVKDDRCREVIESAWESFLEGVNGSIVDQIKRCQYQLKWWNQRVFRNVNTRLKKLKECLQFLEAQNLLTETASEIQGLKKEIDETLHREEVMWNQRSRVLWLKCEDRNTKFFHAVASQRHKRNKIDGITEEGFVTRGRRILKG